jgi:hypothetical protein
MPSLRPTRRSLLTGAAPLSPRPALVPGSGPPGQVIDQPQQDRTRRFLRRVTHRKTETIAA